MPYENGIADLQVNYYSALYPERYVAQNSKIGNSERKISTIDDIIEHMEIFDTDDKSSIFHSLPNDKCVKIEKFPPDDFRQESQVHLDGSPLDLATGLNHFFFLFSFLPC